MSERIALSTWPTPLEPMPRLAAAPALGEDDLWVKRDDLIGLGGGGNKVRKLEWTVGAALAEGADAPRGERTVLLHTGGLPGLFGHVETARRAVTALRSHPAG